MYVVILCNLCGKPNIYLVQRADCFHSVFIITTLLCVTCLFAPLYQIMWFSALPEPWTELMTLFKSPSTHQRYLYWTKFLFEESITKNWYGIRIRRDQTSPKNNGRGTSKSCNPGRDIRIKNGYLIWKRIVINLKKMKTR